MKVVALVSGGKDSCYNMMQCVSEGHQIVALANLKPEKKDELDSYMFQTVGHHGIDLYAEAIGLPLYRHTIHGSSKSIGRDYMVTENDEVEDLFNLLKNVKEECGIEAVSVGAILSDYQRVRVENVCQRLGLTSLAYLWRRDQEELLKEMIESQVIAVLIKVASLGLEPKHLGKTLGEMSPHLKKMKEKYQLNVCGEGGEYETFTVDCPLFEKRIIIDEVETVIHSDDAFAPVAYLNIKRAHLEEKPLIDEDMADRVKDLPMLRSSQLHSSLQLENTTQDPPMTSLRDESHKTVSLTVSEDKLISVVTEHNHLWITGLIGLNTGNTSLTEITIKTMSKLKEILENSPATSSCGVSCVAMVHLYIQDMSIFGEVNSVYKTYFGINPPARICVQATLPPNVALQIDCYCNKDVNDRQTMHVQGLSHWAPANIGPYSQCVKVKDKLYVAGQIAMCPANLAIISGGIVPQARLSLRHVQRILEAMHCGMDKLNMVVCYVTDIGYVQSAQKELETYKLRYEDGEFGVEEQNSSSPTVVYVEVPRLPKDALIEWQVTARTDLHELSVAEWRKNIQLPHFKCYVHCLHTDEEIISCVISIRSIESVENSLTKKVLDCFRQVLNEVQVSLPATFKSIFPLRIFFSSSQLNINELYQDLDHQGTDSDTSFVFVPVLQLSSPDKLLEACS
ncbi:uncharacterized protein LOC133183801 isoform X2 [Saccostrea echinata]|uniref:uncharacterized protein LOC133183801 isoform X2 n=1 Tax=Saccostrea echinata TaxID=191078 RepID=UPI002A7EBE7F|nr:uncharacterized protein LOC133183801 isoform X2 [Saccostrea echinata]